MKWFKRYRIKAARLPSFLERILIRVNNQLIRLADYLKQRMANLSIQKQKVLLFLFCFVFGSSTILILWNSFQAKQFTSFNTSNIRVVPLLPTNGSKRLYLSIPELKRIHIIKNYLDSLNQVSNGKQIKGRLFLNRPHLLDSLNYLDNLYTEILKSETYGK